MFVNVAKKNHYYEIIPNGKYSPPARRFLVTNSILPRSPFGAIVKNSVVGHLLPTNLNTKYKTFTYNVMPAFSPRDFSLLWSKLGSYMHVLSLSVGRDDWEIITSFKSGTAVKYAYNIPCCCSDLMTHKYVLYGVYSVNEILRIKDITYQKTIN